MHDEGGHEGGADEVIGKAARHRDCVALLAFDKDGSEEVEGNVEGDAGNSELVDQCWDDFCLLLLEIVDVVVRVAGDREEDGAKLFFAKSFGGDIVEAKWGVVLSKRGRWGVKVERCCKSC